MKSFLRTFFAAMLALIVFVAFAFIILAIVLTSVLSPRSAPTVDRGTVLVLDLGNPIREQTYLNPLNALFKNGPTAIPGLYDLTSGIRHAAEDDRIEGIFLELNGDPNGLATNEEIRRTLLDFKRSGKFVYAYGSVISQKAYYTASIADKIFLNPVGTLDFSGFSMQMAFLKGALDKLEITPQIFYEGKYKSATEPLRVTQMTPANKVQTTEYLGNLYHHFLQGISQERHVDTTTLFRYADEGMIQSANDALKYGLVDALKYDDEVKSSLREKLNLTRDDKIPFLQLTKYTKTLKDETTQDAPDKIALLFAQGDIVQTADGNPGDPTIAAERYVRLISKLRRDSSVKAIVLRVNSPGGSALAADEIWRELLLTKQVKPVVVSMGDYAASGGYYISCVADSIFAEANTLTGSIGVFGIIPDLHQFFNNKLGITFDGVKTSKYADMGTITRPLTVQERQFIQSSVDSVYVTFKNRVTEGRNLSSAVVDSIAQGRVWSGEDAAKLGLVDQLGGLSAAIACAAHMAALKSYQIRQYPQEGQSLVKMYNQLTGEMHSRILEKELGGQYPVYRQLRTLTRHSGTIMARLPFDPIVN
jgi:protease-4